MALKNFKSEAKGFSRGFLKTGVGMACTVGLVALAGPLALGAFAGLTAGGFLLGVAFNPVTAACFTLVGGCLGFISGGLISLAGTTAAGGAFSKGAALIDRALGKKGVGETQRARLLGGATALTLAIAATQIIPAKSAPLGQGPAAAFKISLPQMSQSSSVSARPYKVSLAPAPAST